MWVKVNGIRTYEFLTDVFVFALIEIKKLYVKYIAYVTMESVYV